MTGRKDKQTDVQTDTRRLEIAATSYVFKVIWRPKVSFFSSVTVHHVLLAGERKERRNEKMTGIERAKLERGKSD